MAGAAGGPQAGGDRDGGAVGERVARRSTQRDAWMRVGAVAAGVALLVVGSILGSSIYRGPLLFVFLFTAAQAGALVLATVRPRTAAIAALVASAGIMVVAHGGLSPWPWSVTTLITQALIVGTIAYRVRWVEAVIGVVANLLVSGTIAMLLPTARSAESVGVDLVVFTSTAGTLLATGIVLQQRRAIRVQLARERRVSEEERARRLVAEEKTRIARELHDVIAHSMSVINVQASSAPYRLADVGPDVRQEFEQMAASSRRALAEMRSLLSVLREDDRPNELAPQPGLAAIPGLIAAVDRSGTWINLEWVGEFGDEGVRQIVGLAAYRIVQEAVSNALRHSPGSHIDVRCTREPQGLSLLITNGPARRRGVPVPGGAGNGLVGMRERATSLGGTLEHHGLPAGGYVVRAWLPLDPKAPVDHSDERTDAA
ncbi:sensor histidine kinase [Pseudolysinimonas kribbensis]|uniref:sensor histidine kinase n=1 Tax=Pseudolysinimonas kribbensis TaxID=433641 RepID=UPI0031D36392